MFRWTTHDPLRDFRTMQRQMDQVFRGLFPDLQAPRAQQRGPAFNVYDKGEAYVIQAEVPGLRQEELEIEATEDGLTLRFEPAQTQAEVPEGYRAHRRERALQSFSRTFSFESKLDVEQASAALQRGILTLTLTKQAKEQPRKIEITPA